MNHIMNKWMFMVRKCELLILFIALLTGYSGADEGSYTLEWSGTKALREGNYEKALEEILSDTLAKDQGFRFFKLGLVRYHMKDYREALFYFRFCAEKSTKLAPFAYEFIGDIEHTMHRTENALHAYRVALETGLPSPYVRHLRKKVYSVLKQDSTLAAQISWFGEMRESKAEITEEIWMPDFFDTLLSNKEWKLVDSVIAEYAKKPKSSEACKIFKVLEKYEVPNTIFPTIRLFKISRIAYYCRKYKKSSNWLHKGLIRDDFSSSVPTGEYLYHRAILNYRLKNYNKAIRFFDKYEKKYGLTPDIVLMLARSYRNLNKGVKAALWYDKHIKLYPHHPMSHDILWYRAWQHEENHQYEDAIRSFRKLYQSYSRGSRADDSYFRCGLNFYKAEMYDSALATFRGFNEKYSRSSLSTASRYWEGKSCMALKKFSGARKLFHELAAEDPTDYYAYRSREMLTILGDTLSFSFVDTTKGIAETRAWLDSICVDRREPLSSEDSLAYEYGSILAAVGLTDRAEYFLKHLEEDFPRNLVLQFDLSELYRICNEPALSYRVGMRLAWRIASQYRRDRPLPVYSLLYPLPYRNAVMKYAHEHDIDPYLVVSVMRQESIFNPVIESPVGAIGLMQIMPYTGEEIGKDLKENFVLDSLYVPAKNIQYGAYYLKKVMNQFDGNIVLALASYNGGPHNAKKWLNRNKHQTFDMFIENIGFSETRKYVKRVLANYWTYKNLAQALGYPSG
ncbi:MAG: transglycosylase SLT domain-containing protein [Chitinivibrionales bacterium]|nr:transglycosylase SLT domain-containing protein [Chitinivibrionales bacterium]